MAVRLLILALAFAACRAPPETTISRPGPDVAPNAAAANRALLPIPAEPVPETVADTAAPEPAVETPTPEPDEPSTAQWAAYEAHRPKSVIEDQPYRLTTSERVVLPGGGPGTATLVDLAPAVHVWFLLTLDLDDGTHETWHLENPSGLRQHVALRPSGLVLTRADGASVCDLWTRAPTELEVAASSGDVYGPLCGGALAVRNPTIGHKTTLEWTTDFLRDHVWGGDEITNMVKETLVSGEEVATTDLGEPSTEVLASGGPTAARVAPKAFGRLLDPLELGLPVAGDHRGGLEVGAWYPVRNTPSAWVSILQPRYVHPEVLARNAPLTWPLDDVEARAFVYTVAFDLRDFDLGYDVGTEHPRAGWSHRVPDAVRDPSLPGPDGFDTLDPLVRTGLLDPAYLPREVAVFVGGFKRDHGAFRSGTLAEQNAGSHYGSVEFGTELSRLQPGLATLVVDADGTVDLKTWTQADAPSLRHLRHARQNGVPLVESDPATGEPRPGDLVRSWTRGNWSGSVDRELRSMRSGVCIQDGPAGRFLLYSFFASATPSAMADVFTAYGCGYAMLLDMNALEHTYLAITEVDQGEVHVHHLVTGMEVLDRTKRGATWPRFVGYADNRDFFYVLRKP